MATKVCMKQDLSEEEKRPVVESLLHEVTKGAQIILRNKLIWSCTKRTVVIKILTKILTRAKQRIKFDSCKAEGKV